LKVLQTTVKVINW